MPKAQRLTITYKGTAINLLSNERADYINLTDMAKAFKTRRAIHSWLKSKQTLKFINSWEKKYNPNFKVHQMAYFLDRANKYKSLSVKEFINKTGAVSLFSKRGSNGGTYAHKILAIRFAAWLDSDFELHITEELELLRKSITNNALLSHEQILYLTQVKEVFKYVVNQDAIGDIHRNFYASKSKSKAPFSDFHKWRNEVLNIEPEVIEARLMQYCKEKNLRWIPNKTKREKILTLDCYQSIKNAVWDFLEVKGSENALALSKLVEDMARLERKTEIHLNNEDSFFQTFDPKGNITPLVVALPVNQKRIALARIS